MSEHPACPCPATDCDRQIACRPPAPTCPHPFYDRATPTKEAHDA
jgi:hypothetical protein